jgi:SAM-dependent methyltransferase
MVRKTAADWTVDHITRFWEQQARTPGQQPEYFSYNYGRGIAGLLRLSGRLDGKVLDYGCGPGYLLDHLVAAGVNCYGADVSEQSVRRANARIPPAPRWQGAVTIVAGRTPFDDGFFDVVTCIETLEHVPEDLLAGLLAEVRRVLRPGGVALFTTPHAENLDDSLAFCPFCDSEFHRYQHLRSFTADTLTSLLQQHGFTPVFATNLDFRDLAPPASQPNWKSWTAGLVYRSIRRSWFAALDVLTQRRFPEGWSARALRGRGGHLTALVRREV